VTQGFRKFFRHGVISEFSGQWVAAREALEAKPNAAEDAEAFDGLVGVLRAGGLEAASSGEENGEVGLVAADGNESDAHGMVQIAVM